MNMTLGVKTVRSKGISLVIHVHIELKN